MPVRPVRQQPLNEDCQGIGLFPGTAGRAPQAQPLLTAAAALNQRRQDVLGERIKGLAFAEKIGFANGKMARQNIQLRPGQRYGQQPFGTAGGVRETEFHGGGREAALQVRAPLRWEMQPGLLGDEFAQAGPQCIRHAVSPHARPSDS